MSQLSLIPELERCTIDSNEWYSPGRVVEPARQVMGGIELDPASCAEANEVIQAERYFSLQDDGLSQDWKARSLWMNPPYSRDLIGQFVAKFLHHFCQLHIDQAVVLTNSQTGASWYQNLVKACCAVCYPKGRIKFGGPNPQRDGPRMPQTIFYFIEPLAPAHMLADARYRFYRAYQHIGAVGPAEFL